MKTFISTLSTLALAATVAATLQAQDSTATTKTEVKTDGDATAVTATGCVVAGIAPGTFALRGGITGRGDKVTTTSKVETSVDKGETRVTSDERTKAEGNGRVSAGGVTMFDLTTRAGVELASHTGQRVELTAVMLDHGKNDADVTIKQETKVDRDDARDGKSNSESKVQLERGHGNERLMVLSVKQLATTCGD